MQPCVRGRFDLRPPGLGNDPSRVFAVGEAPLDAPYDGSFPLGEGWGYRSDSNRGIDVSLRGRPSEKRCTEGNGGIKSHDMERKFGRPSRKEKVSVARIPRAKPKRASLPPTSELQALMDIREMKVWVGDGRRSAGVDDTVFRVSKFHEIAIGGSGGVATNRPFVTFRAPAPIRNFDCATS